MRKLNIRSVGIAGCCAGNVFADLGGAHGKLRANSQEEFDRHVNSLSKNSINVAITNEYQTREREFLKAQGWEEKQVTPSLILHSISGNNLYKYLRPVMRRYDADAAAKRAEERKKREEARIARGDAPSIKIKIDDIRRIVGGRTQYGWSGTRVDPTGVQAVNDEYEVEVPINGYWDMEGLRRAVYYRLKKKQEANAQ